MRPCLGRRRTSVRPRPLSGTYLWLLLPAYTIPVNNPVHAGEQTVRIRAGSTIKRPLPQLGEVFCIREAGCLRFLVQANGVAAVVDIAAAGVGHTAVEALGVARFLAGDIAF